MDRPAPDYIVSRDATGAIIWRRPPIGQRVEPATVEHETIGRRQITVRLVGVRTNAR